MANEAGTEAAGGGGAAAVTWSSAWQLPVLTVAVAGLVGGAVYAWMHAPAPDYELRFVAAAELMADEKFGEALGALNKEVLPLVRLGKLSPEQRTKYHLMTARALALGQRSLRLDREENNTGIVKQYTAAERRGAALDARDQELLAEAHISLGEWELALARADKLGETEGARRVALYRKMVEGAMGTKRRDDALALDLLRRLSGDGDSLSEADRAWVLSREARILLGQGYAEEMIAKLLRVMPRLEGADRAIGGELYGLLGEAYARTGERAEAFAAFDRAAERLPEHDPLMARVELRRGQLMFNEDKAGAEERFAAVLTRFPETNEALWAQLGLAEVHAWMHNNGVTGDVQLDRLAEAIEAYSKLAEYVRRGEGREAGVSGGGQGKGTGGGAGDEHAPAGARGAAEAHGGGTGGAGSAGHEGKGAGGKGREGHEGHDGSDGHDGNGRAGARGAGDVGVEDGPLTAERVLASLMSNQRDRYEAGDYDGSLRYGTVAEGMYEADRTPESLLLALARTNERRGEQELKDAAGERGGAISLSQVDPATQREARARLLAAGQYYKRHAERVAITDAGAFSDSVWAAATMFDRAGDLESSVEAFQDFAQSFPSDPRNPEARFRLAQARQARGELPEAAKLYRELIENRDAARGSGPFADRSYVPLARTLLEDTDASNDRQGEELLVTVLGGAIGGPATAIYKSALSEAADLYYRTGRYDESIARYEEFLTRYGRPSDDGQTATASEVETAEFKLADGHRLAGAALQKSLEQGGMPESERRKAEAARTAHYTTAMVRFERFRNALGGVEKPSPLQELRLRNAYFYVGDCAFELKDYESAIAQYELARERYAAEPAALVAMTQIVSAHLKLGNVQVAAMVNGRAKRLFDSFPQEVWDDPSLPMDRKQWQRWLESTNELTQTANVGGG